MEIIIVNQCDSLWVDSSIEARVEYIINQALDYLKYQARFNNASVSVVLADNDFVRQLNKTYRAKDKPTNILSFALVDSLDDWDEAIEDNSLGDMIVAYETIAEEAREQAKTFDDHFSHLLVHGLLHLLGYDHIKDEEAEIMEALEIEILKQCSINNPYL